MTSIDIHVHTKASLCSIFPAELLAQKALENNIPVIVTTNHHDCDTDASIIQKAVEKSGVLYIPGMEITNEWGDFLIFGENIKAFKERRDFFPVNLLPRDDVAVIWAHPFRFFPEEEIHRIKQVVYPFIDAIEVINGNCMLKNQNANLLASLLAKELNLPQTGGSDAHSKNMFYLAWTEFEEPVSYAADLVRQIKQGRIRPNSKDFKSH